MNVDNATHWYVMTHFEMKRFQEWLKMENAERLGAGRAIIEPFYPRDFLRQQPGDSSGAEKDAAEAVSEDLANFVFLKSSESDIDGLVNDNRRLGMRMYLRHYLDTDGSYAIVPERMMQDFLQACVKYRGHFEITPPIRSVEAMDKVRIKSGPFAGHEASVERVHLSHGAIHLELALQLVSGVMNIRMSNVDKNKVVILNHTSTDAIRTDFIEYTQNHLLLILEHRIKRVTDETVNRNDADMLTRLYRYRYHQVENESARHHFMALMLICAHLCRYTADEATLREKLLGTLADINCKSESKAATDTRTYLWIALYISTHDPSYREAAKEYVRVHQPKSPKLRRFVSLIRTGKKV